MGRFVNRRMAFKDRKNDTEDKKDYQKFLEIIKKIRSILLNIGPVFGLLTYIALFRYFQEEHISVVSLFSISSTVVLFAITLLGLFIGVILTTLVLLPVFSIYYYLYYPYGSKNGGNKVQGIDWNATHRTREPVKEVVLYLEIIILIVAPSLLQIYKTPHDFLMGLFFVGCGACLLYGINVFFLGKSKRLEVCLGYLLISFFAYACAYLFFSIGYSGWTILIWLMLLIVSSIWLITYLDLLSDTLKRIGYILGVLVVFYIYITPFSLNITKATLRYLEIGYFEDVYHVYQENLSKVPDQFIDKKCCVKGFCLTKLLSIKWGVGDPVYVALSDKENHELKQSIAIPQNILLPYDLHTDMPESCTSQPNYILAKLGK